MRRLASLAFMLTVAVSVNKYLLLLIALLVAGGIGQRMYYLSEIDTLKLTWHDEREELQQLQDTMQTKLITDTAKLDNQYTQELSQANEQIQSLVDDVRSGKRRMQLGCEATKPSHSLPNNTSTTGMDDAATVAEHHRARSESIIRVTAEADQAIIKLSACQTYVQNILKTINKSGAATP